MQQYCSLELLIPLDNVLFGTEAVVSPENVTDEMRNDDKYDCYSVDGAYHNEAFCKLCDVLRFEIPFHQLLDYSYSKGGREVREVLVFHSQDDAHTWIAFDMWQGRTDQCGVSHIGLYFRENLWDEVYPLVDTISQDYFPFSEPHVKNPSKLVQSVLLENHGKCLFEHGEYLVKDIRKGE